MLKYWRTLTLHCRLLTHAIYCCWKASRGNFKDYYVNAMGLHVLLDFGQYQIYFLSFYEMSPDCYFDIYFQVIINTY